MSLLILNMNTSLLVSSFRYLNLTTSSSSILVSLAKWIYEELESQCYRYSKLFYSFERKDYSISKYLVHLVKDKQDIVNAVFRINFRNDEKQNQTDSFTRIVLLKEAGIDMHFNDNSLLRLAFFRCYLNVARLLLSYGADIHSNNEISLRLSVLKRRPRLVKLCLEYGALISDELLAIAYEENCHEIIK